MANVTNWRNAASACRYPFADDCALVDRTGRYRLPDALLIDARLHVPAGSGEAWLASITSVGGGLSGEVKVGDDSLGTFALGSADRSATLVDVHGVSRGLLVFGSDRSLPAAALLFNRADATFTAGCVLRYPFAALRSVSIVDPAGLSGYLSGRVAFAPGVGIQLSPTDGTALRIDALGAIDPDGSAADCLDSLGNPVHALTGLPLSSAGDSRLEADHYAEPLDPSSPRQVLRIDPGTHALTIGLARGL